MIAGSNRGPKRSKWRWPVQYVVVPITTALIAAAATYLALTKSNDHTNSQPTPVASGTASASPGVGQVAANIKFAYPHPNQRVPQCPRIDGSGTIPSGMKLWIIVIPNTKVDPNDYWFGAVATPDGPNRWQARSVSIGELRSVGFHAQLFAVLMDAQWADYLDHALGAAGRLDASSLPPGSTVAGPVHVIRAKDTPRPSCRSN
jgi:hypothetical protein